ncbi:MAG TPA: AI-2E family transporter [Candidatus Copromorpha excrementigallinarum]|uniref:AI-2E family transporter n=1 Tax=Candidatus Allocopromorpha excrementigallinarum TaxID=2840742 RepID=A0A9D1L721_9FIRM|nr:AI-2E family transporter [Candidatus Copromorpha excrementigallinarum]
MERFKAIMKEHTFIKASFFITFNALILYLIYAIITNISWLSSSFIKAVSTLADAFAPLIIGLILAFLLNPLAELINRRLLRKIVKLPADPVKAEKSKKRTFFISVLLTYILVMAAIVAIIYGFAVMILGQVNFNDFPATFHNLLNGIVQYENAFRDWIDANLPAGVFSQELTDVTNALLKWLSDNFSASLVIRYTTNIGGGLVNTVIGIIVSIYLMKDKRFFLGLWRKFLHLVLPQKGNAVVTETLSEINKVLSKFIRGALIDSVFVAVLSSICLSVMGLEAAVFIGVFAGIINIIPYFGPVIGMIPAFLMGLFTGGFWHGALAVIILLVVQQIDANIIYPKVVGTSTGLHPLMILLAVSVFGYFGGILGMLLAVPTAGVIQIFVVKWANSRERKISSRVKESDGEASST